MKIVNKRFQVIGFLVVFMQFGIFCNTQAQHSEVAFSVGALNYQGDAAPGFQLGNTHLGVTGAYRYFFNPAVTWRNRLLVGVLRGNAETANDPFINQTKYQFSTPVIQLGTGLEYNFFNFRKSLKKPKVTPYIFAELAGMFTMPVLKDDVSIDIYGKEKLGFTPAIAIPFGIGVRTILTNHLDLGVELSMTKVLSDNLEGLSSSGKYETESAFYNPTISNDNIYFLGVTLTYRWIDVICPEPSRYSNF